MKKLCLFMAPLLALVATSCGGLRDLSSRPVDDPLAAFPGENPGPGLLEHGPAVL